MKPVRVAIVDSGINAVHSHVGSVLAGVAIHLDDAGEIRPHDDWRDPLGHGTAVAGAVRLFASEADLLAINVFDRTGRAAASQLVAAIDWALANEANLINLSLGTANPDDVDNIIHACDRAQAKGCLVVAAAPSQGPLMWPSCLPDVIGVQASFDLAPDAVGYVDGSVPPWRAFGRPRPLPGPAEVRNFKGSSFAAARVSGMLAGAAGAQGRWDAGCLRDWLIRQAQT